jgi:deoxycytidylate deaminase
LFVPTEPWLRSDIMVFPAACSTTLSDTLIATQNTQWWRTRSQTRCSTRAKALEGYTLYVTPLPPCSQCAAAIIQRGIGRVVIGQKNEVPELWKEQFAVADTMFREAGVAVCVMPELTKAQANDNPVPASDQKPKVAG